MPPTDEFTHGMMGNDLTDDKNIQSQHDHRVSRMCTVDNTHVLDATVCAISYCLCEDDVARLYKSSTSLLAIIAYHSQTTFGRGAHPPKSGCYKVSY